MKQLHLVILATIVMVLGHACAPTYYVSNDHNVPLLSQKGDLAASVSATSRRVDLQTAYAPNNFLGVQLNGSFLSSRNVEDIDLDTDSRFGEMGIGYFCSFEGQYVFELYGLIGIGHVKNSGLRIDSGTEQELLESISVDYRKISLQPSIGYKNSYFECALSLRLGHLNYYHINGSLFYQEEDQRTYLLDNKKNWVLEPAFTIRSGTEKVKAQLQFGRSNNFSNAGFRQMRFYTSLGVVVNMNMSRFVSKEK